MKTTIRSNSLTGILSSVLLLTATIHAQAQSSTADAPTLPIKRVITDSSGRKLDVTILSKEDAGISVTRISDGSKFILPLDKLSAEDREFVNALDTAATAKPESLPAADEAAQTELEFSILGEKIEVTRLGSGPVAVVFFSHTGSMSDGIIAGKETFADILSDKASFFFWEYPTVGPFTEIGRALKGYESGDKEKFRPEFKSIASNVLNQIRQKTGLSQFLVIGNSLGAGVVLWDYADIAKDSRVNFLLVSPTEPFMPLPENLPKLTRTMLLAGVEKDENGKRRDSYMEGDKACAWVRSNQDKSAMDKITESLYGKPGSPKLGYERRIFPKTFGEDHIIIGSEIKNPLLARLIRVNLGLEKPSVLSKPLVDGTP